MMERIINEVAKEFNYPPESLRVGSRREDFVELRAIITGVAFTVGIPLVRVARALGYKSHSATINLLRKYDQDKRIKREVDKIVARLNN